MTDTVVIPPTVHRNVRRACLLTLFGMAMTTSLVWSEGVLTDSLLGIYAIGFSFVFALLGTAEYLFYSTDQS